MENVKKERNYGIDLLRIVSMFMVVALHILGQGGMLNNLKPFTTNYNVAWFLEIAAYCAVNCYALISGYVSVESKYKYTNIIMIWLRVIFYTLGITGLFAILAPDKVGISQIIGAVFPIITKQYWYVTSYFFLFFFIPYLNHIVNTMDKEQLKKLLITILIAMSILPSIVLTDTFENYTGYSALWLGALYIFGAYVKKYGFFEKLKTKTWFVIYFISIVLAFISKVALEGITLKIFGKILYGNLFVSYTSPLILLSGLALLMAFKNLKINKLKKSISFFSDLAFSVYIIHVNKLIWRNIFRNAFVFMTMKTSVVIFFGVLLSAILVFIACIIIDIPRHYLFKWIKLKEKVQKLENKVMTKLNKKSEKI